MINDNIVRKVKLFGLGYYTCVDNNEKELFQFLFNFLLDLKEVEILEFPNIIFYFKDDLCIYQKKNNEFRFSYENIWLKLESNFNFYSSEIRNILIHFIKEEFNIKITNINITDFFIEEKKYYDYNKNKY